MLKKSQKMLTVVRWCISYILTDVNMNLNRNVIRNYNFQNDIVDLNPSHEIMSSCSIPMSICVLVCCFLIVTRPVSANWPPKTRRLTSSPRSFPPRRWKCNVSGAPATIPPTRYAASPQCSTKRSMKLPDCRKSCWWRKPRLTAWRSRVSARMAAFWSCSIGSPRMMLWWRIWVGNCGKRSWELVRWMGWWRGRKPRRRWRRRWTRRLRICTNESRISAWWRPNWRDSSQINWNWRIASRRVSGEHSIWIWRSCFLACLSNFQFISFPWIRRLKNVSISLKMSICSHFRSKPVNFCSDINLFTFSFKLCQDWVEYQFVHIFVQNLSRLGEISICSYFRSKPVKFGWCFYKFTPEKETCRSCYFDSMFEHSGEILDSWMLIW